MELDFKDIKKPVGVKIETNQTLFVKDGIPHQKFFVGYLLADSGEALHIASKGKNSTDAQIVSVISKRIIEEVHFIEPPFELEMNSSIRYYKNCFMNGWNNQKNNNADNKKDQEVKNESKKSS